MRLCCDEMLANLARWLRAAGYDTTLAPAGSDDRALVGWCLREHRILLSRDRHLVAHDATRLRTLLMPDRLDDQAAHLAGTLGVDWLHAPLTRCMVDNTVLHPASAVEASAVPPRARGLPGPIRRCPTCLRLYWPGSHARRMLAQLEAWHARAGGS